MHQFTLAILLNFLAVVVNSQRIVKDGDTWSEKTRFLQLALVLISHTFLVFFLTLILMEY